MLEHSLESPGLQPQFAPTKYLPGAQERIESVGGFRMQAVAVTKESNLYN